VSIQCWDFLTDEERARPLLLADEYLVLLPTGERLHGRCEECGAYFIADYPGDLFCEDCEGMMTMTMAEIDPLMQDALDALRATMDMTSYHTGGKDG